MEWPQSESTTTTHVNEFINLWRQGGVPDVFQFLASHPTLPAEEQLEIVRIDQHRRWESGNAIPVERYFAQLPFLHNDLQTRFELVYEELQLFRRRWLSNTLELPFRMPEPDDGRTTALAPEPSPLDSDDQMTTVLCPNLSDSDTKTHSRAYFRDILPQCGPFASLPAMVLDLIASYMKRVTFPPGSVLLQQGDPGEHLLLLAEGTVEILLNNEQGRSQVIDRDAAPTILGEMALLTKERRRATVVATSTVTAGILPAKEFTRLRADHPILGTVLTSLLADRIGNKKRDALGGRPLGGYHVHERVGFGGMGIVYRATHVETNEVVALKMLSHRQVHDREAVVRFQQEAEILRQLNHPNIARVHSWFPAFETYFLAMDFCDGVTLSRLIRTHGRLPIDQIRRVVGGVSAALRTAHQESIVHRDLKPQNIMISQDGTVLLMDFGLATKSDPDDPVEHDLIMGTPRYMAPEQHHTANVDERCDLFALGCIIYEMLRGEPLFPQTDRYALFTAKVEFELPSIHDLGAPEGLYQVLEKTLRRDPRHRDLDLAELVGWVGRVDPDLVMEALQSGFNP